MLQRPGWSIMGLSLPIDLVPASKTWSAYHGAQPLSRPGRCFKDLVGQQTDSLASRPTRSSPRKPGRSVKLLSLRPNRSARQRPWSVKPVLVGISPTWSPSNLPSWRSVQEIPLVIDLVGAYPTRSPSGLLYGGRSDERNLRHQGASPGQTVLLPLPCVGLNVWAH